MIADEPHDQRFRLTIRGDDPVVELRGYLDHWSTVERLTRGLRDYFGDTVMVMVSVVDDDYDPFADHDVGRGSR